MAQDSGSLKKKISSTYERYNILCIFVFRKKISEKKDQMRPDEVFWPNFS